MEKYILDRYSRIDDGMLIFDSVVSRVFAEGSTVTAGVSLWEALATFLINRAPYRRRIRLYERIAAAPLRFNPPRLPER